MQFCCTEVANGYDPPLHVLCNYIVYVYVRLAAWVVTSTAAAAVASHLDDVTHIHTHTGYVSIALQPLAAGYPAAAAATRFAIPAVAAATYAG